MESHKQDNSASVETIAGNVLTSKISPIRLLKRAALGITISNMLSKDSQILERDTVNLDDARDLQMVVSLLRKTSKKSMREMVFLKKAFESLQFFKQQLQQGIQPKLYEMLFEKLEYAFFKKNSVVFHCGEQATHFYIILKGNCVLLSPEGDHVKSKNYAEEFEFLRTQFQAAATTTKQQITNSANAGNTSTISNESLSSSPLKSSAKLIASESFKFFESKSQLDHSSLSHHQFLSKQTSTISPEPTAATFDFFAFIRHCFPDQITRSTFLVGDSFGDMPLLTRGKHANTVVCAEDTHVMKLNKEGFETILGEQQKQLLKDRLEFLRTFEFINSCVSDVGIMQLISSSQLHTFHKGDIIYRESEPASSIYFIISGEVELSQQMGNSSTSGSNNNNNINNTHADSIASPEHESSVYDSQSTTSNRMHSKQVQKQLQPLQKQQSFTSLNNNDELRRKFKNKAAASNRRAKFAIISNRECFGEAECLRQTKLRNSKATCTSLSLELLSLPIEVLSSGIPAEGLRILKEYSDLKEEQRRIYVEQIQATSQLIEESQKSKQIHQLKSQSEKHLTSHTQPSLLQSHEPVNRPKNTNANNNYSVITPSSIYSQPQQRTSLQTLPSAFNLPLQDNPTTIPTPITPYNNNKQLQLIHRNQQSHHVQPEIEQKHPPPHLLKNYTHLKNYESIQSPTRQSLPTDDEQSEFSQRIREFTRGNLKHELNQIHKKKRNVLFQLKQVPSSIQSSPQIPSANPNSQSIQESDELPKKRKHKQKKLQQQHVLFDYLFVETPLLNKILSSKGGGDRSTAAAPRKPSHQQQHNNVNNSSTRQTNSLLQVLESFEQSDHAAKRESSENLSFCSKLPYIFSPKSSTQKHQPKSQYASTQSQTPSITKILSGSQNQIAPFCSESILSDQQSQPSQRRELEIQQMKQDFGFYNKKTSNPNLLRALSIEPLEDATFSTPAANSAAGRGVNIHVDQLKKKQHHLHNQQSQQQLQQQQQQQHQGKSIAMPLIDSHRKSLNTLTLILPSELSSPNSIRQDRSALNYGKVSPFGSTPLVAGFFGNLSPSKLLSSNQQKATFNYHPSSIINTNKITSTNSNHP